MFRKSAMLAAAGALALFATPALAAGDASPQAGAGTQSQTQDKAREQARNLLDQSIQNRQGDTIGEIESVILDANGNVTAVIASIGGFLGVGERAVAIDWNELQIRDGGRAIQSSMSRAQLERLPQYEYGQSEQRGTAFIDRRVPDPQAARKRSENRLAAQSAREPGQDESWTGADRIRASDLLGASVVSQSGEEIGDVEDIIIVDGENRIVLGVGEFLGMGGQSVVLKLADAEIQQRRDRPDELRLSVSLSKQELKSLPAYDSGRWESEQGSRK